MAEAIKAVLFDYGLVLSGPPDPGAWAEMKAILSLDEERFAKAYWLRRLDYDRGTISGRAYWREIAAQAGLNPDESRIDRLVAADTVLWTQLNQPMVDWALRLQAAGTRTGILSNIGDEMMHGVLATLPWMNGFHHHTWSHTLLMTKPETAIYLHAAEGLGMSPAHVLFIDDREENIAGAHAAGMQAVQYNDQPQFERALEELGAGELWKMGRTAAE